MHRHIPLKLELAVASRFLLQRKTRLVTAVLGVAFSVFLMNFQGGLFFGFRQAAGTIVMHVPADLWVMPSGVSCFDFTTEIDRRYGSLVLADPAITSYSLIINGFANWKGRAGDPRAVLVVGMPARGFVRFNLAGLSGASFPFKKAVYIDRSAAVNLDVDPDRPGERIKINEQTMTLAGYSEGFGSFLGAPYVFMDHEDAGSLLGRGPEKTSLVGLSLSPQSDPQAVKARLKARFPELSILTSSEFAASSATFWMMQTGAGGALALAGFLGIIIGTVIISQTTYATTSEFIDEFATLVAIGGSDWLIIRIVAVKALMAGLAGFVLGVIAFYPAAYLAEDHLVSWMYAPTGLVLASAGLTIVMSIVAAHSAIRLVLAADPAKVFRA